MNIPVKAYEVGGVIDGKHQLVLNEPLPVAGPAEVRVIVLVSEEAQIEEDEWLRAGSGNPVFDFLKHPEEDMYTLQDGRAFCDES